jgi:Tfp pilus assembly protein PilF
MKTILKVYCRLLLVIVPVVFLPIVVDGFGFGKNWFLVAMVALGLLIWGIGLILNKDKPNIRWSPVMSWLVVWLLWATVSFFLETVGVRARTAMGLPGWATVLGLVGGVFLWLQTMEKGEEDRALKYLTIVGLVVALVSLVIFLIPAKKLPINFPLNNPLISVTSQWSLVGGTVAELWLLVVLVWAWGQKLWTKIKGREKYISEAILGGFFLLVTLLDVYKLFKVGLGSLDLRSSWMIAVEALKQKPLMGSGIGNFVEAFYWWRPIQFNSSPIWANVYQWSGSWLLQVWTELGLVGLVTWFFVWWQGWKRQVDRKNRIKVMLLGLVLLILPFNLVGLLLWLWLAVGSGEGKVKELPVSFKVGEKGFNVAPTAILVLMVVGVAFGGYWWTRILVGEIYFRQSLVAAAKNDGGQTYNLQIKAISQNVNYAEYRRVYSQTNIALASSMLSNKGISEEDKQKAVVLIQQAVREAKAAVAMDNKNPAYWSNLAVVYKQLVGMVDGASDWGIQAYSQAMALDPVNPMLRLDFGGLLYALGGYDEADRLFEQAVTLKNDFANGWYNWAYTAKQQKKLTEAVARLTQALALVSPESGDYQKASGELADWKKELAATTPVAGTSPETLKLPEAIPSGTKSVNVPKTGLEPPVGEVTPTPMPTGTQ